MTNFFESLDTLIEAPKAPVVRQSTVEYQHVEVCPSCRGTGQFRSWSGRAVGECFKCKGAGKRTFKTSPEARQKSRESSANKALEKSRQLLADVEDFKAANPEVFAWLENNTAFEFAASLREALYKFGSLTEGQLNAAKKCVAKLQEKKAAKQAAAQTVDVSRIEAAFDAAKSNGIKKPKLNLGAFKFKPAPVTGRNPNAIYVMSGETYLGKVDGGKFFKAYACTEAMESEVVAAAANPSEAAKAYGLRTGSCSVCNRALTNGASIDLGIGPICADKFGW